MSESYTTKTKYYMATSTGYIPLSDHPASLTDTDLCYGWTSNEPFFPSTKDAIEFCFGSYKLMPSIEKVIFNDPATIVLWSDKTKTVVKVKEGETFDRWTGLSMAICKKLYGDKFHSTFEKFCGREEIEAKVKEDLKDHWESWKDCGGDIFNLFKKLFLSEDIDGDNNC